MSICKDENGALTSKFTLSKELISAWNQYQSEYNDLVEKLCQAEKALQEHRKEHPFLSQEVLTPLVKALCERLVERGLLNDPEVQPIEATSPDYAVSITGPIDEKTVKQYVLRLRVGGRDLCAIRADSGCVGYLNLNPPCFDLDNLIDHYMQHYSKPKDTCKSLDTQVKSASSRTGQSRDTSTKRTKSKGPDR